MFPNRTGDPRAQPYLLLGPGLRGPRDAELMVYHNGEPSGLVRWRFSCGACRGPTAALPAGQ
jgi:hypothetical protein